MQVIYFSAMYQTVNTKFAFIFAIKIQIQKCSLMRSLKICVFNLLITK